METRHLVQGLFGSKFSTICNHCGVTVAWSRNTLKFCEKFLRFLERKNDQLRIFFQTSVPKFFTASSIDVVVFKFREIWPTGNWRNRALFTGQKNFACFSNGRYCTDRAQNLPWPTPNSVLTLLKISSQSVHFRRCYSRTREHLQIAS